MAIQNPVTAEEMLSTAQRIKFTIPPTHEKDYLTLLGKTDGCCELIMAQDGGYCLPFHLPSLVGGRTGIPPW
jgi:hypothetical protein